MLSSNWPDRYNKRLNSIPKHLKIDGYTYTFREFGMKTTRRALYRCIHGSRSTITPCPAVLEVDFSTELSIASTNLKIKHTCEESGENIEVSSLTELDIQNKISEIYMKSDSNHNPDSIYLNLLRWLDEEATKNNSRFNITQKYVRNYVHKLNQLNQKNKFSFDTCLTKDQKCFLLFCVRIKDKPIYGFASPFMVQKTGECSIIGIDGTFHSAPSNAFQVCIFMGRTNIMNIPLLFIILPNKKEKTYVCAFNTYLACINSLGISFKDDAKFVCDFEISEINAIKKVFISNNRKIQLCYFHYTKSINEKIENNPFLIDLFYVLKLLPLIDIKIAQKFILFLSDLRISEDVERFIKYFIDTYTKRFKIEDWNITSKPLPNRATNNVNERFNSHINSKIGKSPMIQDFINTLIEIEEEFRIKYENLKASNTINFQFSNDIERLDIPERFCKGINNMRKYPEFSAKLANEKESFFGMFQDGSFEIINFEISPPFAKGPHCEIGKIFSK